LLKKHLKKIEQQLEEQQTMLNQIRDALIQLINIQKKVLISDFRRAPTTNPQIPEPLSQTLEALKTFGAPATAFEISKITGRGRSRESECLNHLYHLGYVEKVKDGKTVRFKPKTLVNNHSH